MRENVICSRITQIAIRNSFLTFFIIHKFFWVAAVAPVRAIFKKKYETEETEQGKKLRRIIRAALKKKKSKYLNTLKKA